MADSKVCLKKWFHCITLTFMMGKYSISDFDSGFITTTQSESTQVTQLFLANHMLSCIIKASPSSVREKDYQAYKQQEEKWRKKVLELQVII